MADLLWGSPRQPKRGPRPGLRLDAIVAAGIAVADAEGLAALSMQRVATELGYAKMALYRHVPGKAELTALMIDTAAGPCPPLTGDWRARLRAWALGWWAVSRAHPWMLIAAVGPRVMGPNELGWLESGLAAISELGLPGAAQLDAIVLVSGHIQSLAMQTAWHPTGAAEVDVATAMAGVLATHSDTYPRAAAAFADPTGRENALEFGLDRILDGLAAARASEP